MRLPDYLGVIGALIVGGILTVVLLAGLHWAPADSTADTTAGVHSATAHWQRRKNSFSGVAFRANPNRGRA